MKVYRVDSVTVIKQNENPLTLIIHVAGTVSSSGWSNPALDDGADPVPGDPVFEFDLVATPPDGISLPVLLPIFTTRVLAPGRGVDAVIVNARTNSITVHASEFLSGAPAPAGGGGAAPAALARAALPSTLAVGEEGPPMTTQAEGVPEGHPPTFAIGQGETAPMSLPILENATTLMVGEEDPRFTTLRLGEETWTGFIGEHTTTLRLGEESLTDPRLDDPIGIEAGGLRPLDPGPFRAGVFGGF